MGVLSRQVDSFFIFVMVNLAKAVRNCDLQALRLLHYCGFYDVLFELNMIIRVGEVMKLYVFWLQRKKVHGSLVFGKIPCVVRTVSFFLLIVLVTDLLINILEFWALDLERCLNFLAATVVLWGKIRTIDLSNCLTITTTSKTVNINSRYLLKLNRSYLHFYVALQPYFTLSECSLTMYCEDDKNSN